MLPRARRLSVTRFVLALMLCAQATLAWSGCDWLQRSPERALRTAAVTVDAMPCHQVGKGAVCVARCLSEKQAMHKVTVDVHTMPLAPVLTLALPLEAMWSASSERYSDSRRGAGPPRRILLQSFQI